MLLAILVFLSALAIAGCAAYFSIVGLTMLFVSSSLSIIIMGAALELGKLITVSFLHQQWEKINLLLKTYLILASVLLSAITSVGIYGYLAAGYNAINIKVKNYEQLVESNNKLIEVLKNTKQTLSVEPDYNKELDILNVDKSKFIEQQLILISQKEKRISELRSSIETERIKATEQLNDAKLNLENETKKEIDQIKLFNDRLTILDAEVQSWMNQGTGGLFKQNGLEKARETKLAQESERAKIDEQIKTKQASIETLRKEYTLKVKEISTSLNERIVVIEDRIKSIEKEITKDKQDIDAYTVRISEAVAKVYNKKQINAANADTAIKEKEDQIQKLQTTNAELQSKIIETDVGTFKFVANSLGITLDKTVNWFIWLIMFVFDPLAVTLIICFNHLVKNKNKLKSLPEKQIVTPVPTTTFVQLASTASAATPPSLDSANTVYGTYDQDGVLNVGPGHNKVPNS